MTSRYLVIFQSPTAIVAILLENYEGYVFYHGKTLEQSSGTITKLNYTFEWSALTNKNVRFHGQ